MYRYPIPIMLLLASGTAFSAPFTSCPSEAFLFQGSPTAIYSVDLSTGSLTTLTADVGEAGNINAVGFNDLDDYLYGFNLSSKTIKKVGNAYTVEETITVTGLPASLTFFVGDVQNDIYYIYRKGYGIYTIDLSTVAGGTVAANLIGGSVSNRNFTDIAMHPSDNTLYGIDNRNGKLYAINKTTGVATSTGNTGVKGTFGAAYFGSTGDMFIARNSDGKIFRIADVAAPTAVLFAVGSSARQNDGARCPTAVIPVTNTDFGDSPDTYGTLFASNGARHNLTGGALYMGAANADAEADALVGSSDDVTNVDDEGGDGVSISTVTLGQISMVSITVPANGYLNAWADWNIDGDFNDADEQIFGAKLLTAGANTLKVKVPSNARQGASWTRWRFSSERALGPTGGAPDGEVEDHPITINPEVNNEYQYPPVGYFTAGFEDAWPNLFDYDVNDMVVSYKVKVTAQGANVQQIHIEGHVNAIGAYYENGIALHFPGLARGDIEEANILFTKKGVEQTTNPLEVGQTNAVIVFSENAKSDTNAICPFYRTRNDCQQDNTLSFEVTLPIKSTSTVPVTSMPSAPYDIFIFASPNTARSGYFNASQSRGFEIHLEDYPPTDLGTLSSSFFNTGDDASDVGEGLYYRTSNNLPFGVVVNGTWGHPKEHIDLTVAYPNFSSFVTTGDEHPDWYIDAKRVSAQIYGAE